MIADQQVFLFVGSGSVWSDYSFLSFLGLFIGNIHLATTINNPRTLIVVDVINAINTLSDKEKFKLLKPVR
jgi:hypothetical protein